MFKKAVKIIIILLVSIILVIVAGLLLWKNHKKAKLEEALTASHVSQMNFDAAEEALLRSTADFGESKWAQALNGDSATNSIGFLKIADEYSSTRAGNLANLYCGLCYAHMDKWEEAVKYLEKFDTSDDYLISPAALGALGNAYAHVKKLDEAVSTLQKAAEKADNIMLSPVYYLQAGEILESQGKKADALQMYQKVKQYKRLDTNDGSSLTSPYVEMIDEYIQRVSE